MVSDTNRGDEAELLSELAELRELLRRMYKTAERIKEHSAAAEQQLSRELEEERDATRAARFETRELRHRVKNTLAIVQAIANTTLLRELPLNDLRDSLARRIEALAGTYDVLFEENWSSVSLGDVVERSLAPHIEQQARRIRVRGTTVLLAAKPALALGLALNELATNAVKYGALSDGRGHVTICWLVAAQTSVSELRLRWRECKGPQVVEPNRTGFGSFLIRRNLAAAFNGAVELAFPSCGVICTLRAPIGELHRA
jgi:two-component sensor histidine kinase